MATDVGIDGWVRVPLSHDQVVVPAGSPRSWGPAVSLTSPCRGALLAAHRVLEAVGPCLPAAHRYRGADESVLDVVERARKVMVRAGVDAGSVTAMAVGLPRQAGRGHGVALVESRSGPRVFLKWSDDRSQIETEAQLLASLDGGLGGCRTPRLLARGSETDVAWLSTTALPEGRHRPCWSPPWSSVATLMAAADPDPAPRPGGGGRGAGEEMAHGDFAPWNVRRSGHQVWIIDWADAGPRPSGFDRLYFETCAAALGHCGARVPESAPTSAIESVGAVIRDRIERRGEPLDLAMERVLDTVEPR